MNPVNLPKLLRDLLEILEYEGRIPTDEREVYKVFLNSLYSYLANSAFSDQSLLDNALGSACEDSKAKIKKITNFYNVMKS